MIIIMKIVTGIVSFPDRGSTCKLKFRDPSFSLNEDYFLAKRERRFHDAEKVTRQTCDGVKVNNLVFLDPQIAK